MGATFINDHEALSIELLSLGTPLSSLLLVLFARCHCLFFRVYPADRMARLIVAELTLTPERRSHI